MQSKDNIVPIKPKIPFNNGFDWGKYPHPKFTKDGEITGAINHIDNLACLLNEYGIDVRYNLITKDQEFIIPNTKAELKDNKKMGTLEFIKGLCEINHFPVSRVQDQLVALANKNPINPIVNYCKVIPWDGINRLDDVVNTVITDPTLNQWKKAAIVKFSMAAVCAAMNDEQRKFKFKSVLTFQGKQGLGKTPFIKILMGDMSSLLLQGHNLNPDSKDSVIVACKHWIVELGELDRTTKKSDVAGLKAVIDRYQDDIRLPYASEISSWIRRTVFFGTVNPASFLMDNTGNDRFWTIPVLQLKLDELEAINIQQYWAQIYQLVITDLKNKVKEPWALTDEERKQQTLINEAFRSLIPIEEAIRDAFEDKTNEPIRWHASLFEICEALGFSRQKLSPKEKAAAEIMLANYFVQSKFSGKRGYQIPHIERQSDIQLTLLGMKKRTTR